MRESLYIKYDGIKSEDMGVIQISEGEGLFDETFMHSRTINEEKIKGNDNPYFKDIERDTLVLPLSFWFEKGMTPENVNKVKRWLNQPYYKPLWFSSHPDRIFYAMYQGSMNALHNGIEQGYINLEMKCNSPYAYSPIYRSIEHDLSNNPTSGTIIEFENKGDIECKPIFEIETTADGNISIINTSNGGQELTLEGLTLGEKITVDNENEEIETDLVGAERYGDHNDVFISCPSYSVSRLLVKGKCKIQFIYQYQLL